MLTQKIHWIQLEIKKALSSLFLQFKLKFDLEMFINDVISDIVKEGGAQAGSNINS